MGDRYTACIITDKDTGGGHYIYSHWSGWRGDAVMVTAAARFLKLDPEQQVPGALVNLVAHGFGYNDDGSCIAEITSVDEDVDEARARGDHDFPRRATDGVAIDLSHAGGSATVNGESYSSLESFVREAGPRVMQDQLDGLAYGVDYEREAQGLAKTHAKHYLILRSATIHELSDALEDLGIEPIAPRVTSAGISI